ncbi:MAG: cob(I)yrinic acid a,c-diamide adenosyltransferase [Actinomycetota bacterium]|nr:cob(I)yrinic acid a,c-diamide adenosyltransferase [Actinomycetota bacterium]
MKKSKLERGLVQIYTGEGKGKTTAALGLALRAVGGGFKVYMFQFLKRSPTGELTSAKLLEPSFKLEQCGRGPEVHIKEGFTLKVHPEGEFSEEDRRLVKAALERARRVMKSGQYDVVILDEINLALHYHLVELDEVLRLIEDKPTDVELILTGRYAPPELIEVADLVTEMVEVKHPFKKGIRARRGIEF